MELFLGSLHLLGSIYLSLEIFSFKACLLLFFPRCRDLLLRLSLHGLDLLLKVVLGPGGLLLQVKLLLSEGLELLP